MTRSRAILSLFLFTTCLAATRAHAQPEKTLEAAADAARYNDEGQYLRSLTSLAADPDEAGYAWQPGDLLRAAEANSYLGFKPEAEREIDSLLETYPQSPWRARALLQQGLISFQRREYGQARLQLNEVVRIAEESEPGIADSDAAGRALYWIGISHLLDTIAPMPDHAIQALAASATTYPENQRADDALFALGQVTEQKGEIGEAINYYGRLLTGYPQSEYAPAAGIRRIQGMLALRRFDDARDQLEAIAGMFSDSATGGWNHPGLIDPSAEYHLLSGETHSARKDYVAAERAYMQVTYRPESQYRRPAQLGLARIYLTARRLDSARAILERTIDERTDDPTGMEAMFRQALVLQSQGDTATAIDLLERIGNDSLKLGAGRASLELAGIRYRRHEYEAAEQILERVQTATPSSRERAQAGVLLGSVRLATGRFADAATVLSDAEERAAATPAVSMPERDSVIAIARLLGAIALVRAGRPSEAIPKLNRFLQNSPHHPDVAEAAYWLGEAYLRAELLPAAIQAMENLIETYPASRHVEDAIYAIGSGRFKQRKLELAEAAWARLVKAYPMTRFAGDAQMRRGDCLYLMKKLPEAIVAYTAAAGSGDSEVAAHSLYQKALAEYHLERYTDAARSFGEYLKANPNGAVAPDAEFMIGMAHYQQGNDTAAIASLNRLIDRHDSNALVPRAYATIASARYDLGEYEAARAAGTIVVERYPASQYAAQAKETMGRALQQLELAKRAEADSQADREAGALLEQARVYHAAHDYPQALTEYRRAAMVSHDTSHTVAAWRGIARVYLESGDTTAAVDTLEWIAETFAADSAAPRALLEVVDIELVRGDTASAVKRLEDIATRYPDREAAAEALVRAGGIHLRRNQLAEADSAFGDAAARSSRFKRWNGEARMGLAALREARGEKEAARKLYEQILSEHEGDDIAVRAQARLAALSNL